MEREPGPLPVAVADRIGLPGVRESDSQRPLVYVCHDAADALIPDAVSRGATALVARSDAPGGWQAALDAVLRGSNWISPVVAGHFLRPDRPPRTKLDIRGAEQLSRTQRLVLDLMTTGITRTEAARRLSVQESTVAYHIRKGLQRLGCANIRELQARIIGEQFGG
ncbi:helix-turn-helix transcriptional regulator [Streptomyces sp. NPDC004031]